MQGHIELFARQTELAPMKQQHVGQRLVSGRRDDADPPKIAQGLEPAAHNSLFAGSILFQSNSNGAGYADTERTTRFR
jgi:hypothetical protein